MVYDVAIIGGGVTGGMVAYYLSKYDLKIAIIEKNDDVGAGISKANSAIVHAGYDAECGTLKAKLNVRGAALMPDVCKKLGVPYINCGSHVVAFSDDDMKTLEKLKKRGEENGVPGLEIISGDTLRSLEPSVSEKALGSLHAKTAGIVSPYALALAACMNAVTNGADIFLESEVTDIKKSDDGIISITASGKEIKTRYAVNTAGIYSDVLAKTVGDDVPEIIPRRGEYYLLDKRTNVKVNSTIFCCPSEKGKGILVSPTVHGNIIVGPNAERVEHKNDTETSAEGLLSVANGAVLLCPGVNLRDTITTFAGVRPTPSTHDFYIEKSSHVKGLINAVGIESPGLASSPASGEYISEMLFSMGLEKNERKEYFEGTTKKGNIKLFAEMSNDEKAEAIKNDSSYGRIICRCETVTEGDIKEMLRSPIPPRSIDGVKRRTRAGMGRCQGGFCQPYVAKLIAGHFGKDLTEITKFGAGSKLLTGKSPKGGEEND